MKFLDPKTGWRTYAVVAVGIGLGIADYFGVHVPSYVDWGLTFLGLGTLRAGVKTQTAQTAAQIAQLAELVLQNITVPDPAKDATGNTIPIPSKVEVSQLPPVTK